MLFNSLQFVVFFIIVFFAYFSLAHRFRWVLLLVASYYFYMCWKPEYLILILASTMIDYWMGIKIEEESLKCRRKYFLTVSLVVNLGLLFTFKYFNFFSASFSRIMHGLSLSYDAPLLNVLLPVGISFYTFQTLSYTIEVYRGHKKAERHLGMFALYVSFFPQLVAGPIERAGHLLPQLRQKINFDYARIRGGLQLMLWGMFKKVVIADRVGVVVNTVYGSPLEYQGFPLVMATVFFAFQIYCDFSGYTDIAIGAADVLGIKLMKNFDRPYHAQSIREFWQRWHISLSTWFRDYVYIPLGGNRSNYIRWVFNVFITFLVSGLWHGANWTFVIWGGLHGFYYLIEMKLRSNAGRVVTHLRANQNNMSYKWGRIGITFCLVCFGWIFFRANNLQDASYIAVHMFTGWDQPWFPEARFNEFYGLTLTDFCIGVGAICLMEAVHMLQYGGSVRDRLNAAPVWLRWGVYLFLLLAIVNLSSPEEIPFIYFQF